MMNEPSSLAESFSQCAAQFCGGTGNGWTSAELMGVAFSKAAPLRCGRLIAGGTADEECADEAARSPRARLRKADAPAGYQPEGDEGL